MSLPIIPPIPLKLPIDIPTLLHPAIVHFAIAIPIVVILLEFINLFFKKRALSVFSLFLIFVLAVVMVGAYFTGLTDGKEAFSALSQAGQSDLKAHKLLGIYLAYASVILILLKLLFMLMSNFIARFFFLIILIGFSAVILKQGHDGGDLVYKYGANSEAIANVVSDKDDLKDELDELQEKYNELKKSSATKKEEVKEEPKVEETKSEEVKSEEPKAKEAKATETKSQESKAEETKKEENTTADANKSE